MDSIEDRLIKLEKQVDRLKRENKRLKAKNKVLREEKKIPILPLIPINEPFGTNLPWYHPAYPYRITCVTTP